MSSQALSTHINTEVTFPDLSLKSQVIYLAMLETWRVIKEITQEEVEVAYQEDTEDTNNKEEMSSTEYLMEDIMKELEDINTTNEFDEVDTKIEEYDIKETMDNNTFTESHNLPDSICGHDVNSLEAKDRKAALDLLPDLVTCCQTACGGHQSNLTCRLLPRQNNFNHCQNFKAEQQRTSHGVARASCTSSPEKDDLSKVDDRLVPTNVQHRMIVELHKTAQEERKASWAQTGRQLARVAEQATDKRRSLDTRKHSGGREEGDADNPDYHHRRHTLTQPSAQHSNLMSNLALCGISYLVKL